MTTKGSLRVAVFYTYIAVVEIFAVAIFALAIFSIYNTLLVKIRLWEVFYDAVPNLLPILACIAASIMFLSPIMGLYGVIKRKQIYVSWFVGLMVVVALFWLAIACWCFSLHQLTIDNMRYYFYRLKRDGSYSGESRNILVDLNQNMPFINTHMDYTCCSKIQADAAYTCADACREKYIRLLNELIFPVIYSVLIGASVLSSLAVLSACTVCCYLDDVNPFF